MNSEKIILVCADTGCAASGSNKVLNKLRLLQETKNLENVKVIQTGCFGLCSKGPFVVIKPDNICYSNVKEENCEEIIKSIINDTIIKELLIEDIDGKITKKLDDVKFFSKQNRNVLKLCGVIDPENIEDYINNNGYKAYEKAKQLTSKQIIDEISNSKLRGRGGAGFYTGQKWASALSSDSDIKYIVCNADEGDPGAFMDRSILEGNPHSIIEGMLIAALAVNAAKGYIYVRAEYPKAVKRLKLALASAREKHFLGTNFDIEIRLGAGAFVCGEETALLESIEGKKGKPRGKPPYPTEKGLFGKPTVINNVETLANIPSIILNGENWYRSLGSETSGGTKVFALGGNVVNTGLVEVPIGLTLREIIYDIGGGIPNNKKFKAAQTGGPSGGCISEKNLDVKMDYESLQEIGSMMGSGGLIVMDDSKCMVALAKFYTDFSVDESCGKCTPCRIGIKRMSEILGKICCGNATLKDLEILESLANTITKTSVCGLGQTAPNPVLSTLKYFKEEYINHITNKTCDAGECNLNAYISIDKSLCKGCSICQKVCPVNAIDGEKQEIRVINVEKCIKCKTCINACPFKAIKG